MLPGVRSNPISLPCRVLLAAFIWGLVPGSAHASFEALPSPKQINMHFAQLPLSFVRNVGQIDKSVQYYERADSHATFFSPDAVRFRFNGTRPRSTGDLLTLRFLGQAPDGRALKARGPLEGHVNYIIGRDPKKWFNRIPMFKEVVYERVFPDTDIHFYGNQRQLEYDIVLKPGADPEALRFAYEGAENLRLNDGGDLEIFLGNETIIQHRPTIFQEVAGVRHTVSGSFVLLSQDQISSSQATHGFGFKLGRYDPKYPLVIDPVLVYSTYLGGTHHDHAHGIAVDGSGNTYIAGETRSLTFPIVAPIQTAMAGDEDAFVTKLNAGGTAILYSTYLGGHNHDEAYGISIDASGNAYISGSTRSSTFPVSVSAYQSTLARNDDAFLIELDPSGAMLYSTFLGGRRGDRSFSNANDGTGVVYVGGTTSSNDFPTLSAYQSARGGDSDAFIAKIDTTKVGAASLIYSTYLGGKKDDEGNSIAVNPMGEVFIAGKTESKSSGGSPFPVTASAYQSSLSGEEDAFLTRLSASGNSLIYSTYLGGSKEEEGWGVALSGTSVAFVTGVTESKSAGSGTAFPTTVGALQTAHIGEKDAFVSEIDTSIGGGSGLIYSTYLGGSNKDVGYAIAVDGSGRAHITGYSKVTNKTPFPVTPDAIQGTYAGNEDAFYVILDPTQFGSSGLIFSTYLGGKKFDQGRGIALDGSGNAYITGKTRSEGTQSFPTTVGSFQSFSAGNEDAFIAKIGVASNAPPVIGADPTLTVSGGGTVTSGNVLANDTDPEGNPLTITVFDATSVNGGTVVYNYNGTFTYTAAAGFSGTDTFTYTVSDGVGGTVVVTQTVTVNGLPVIGVDPVLTVSGGGTVTSGNVLANDTDPEGNPLTVSAFDATTVNGGTVTFNAGTGQFTYTAAAGFSGTDTFTYTVSDGAGGTVVVTQSVTVAGTCVGSSVLTSTGTAVNVSPTANINVQYATVTGAGTTCLTNPGPVAPAPNGFRFGTQTDIFSLSTTATTAGTTQICFVFDPTNYLRIAGLKLVIFQGGTWVNITSSLSTVTNTICGLTSGAIGTYAVIEELPTAISLRSFNVARAGDAVDIQWVTTSETDNWGFRILRARTPEGPFQVLNAQLIPALGGPGLDMTYHFQDYSAPQGTNYYYRLQDVDTRGLVSEHSVIALLDETARIKRVAGNSAQGRVPTNTTSHLAIAQVAPSQPVSLILPAAGSQGLTKATTGSRPVTIERIQAMSLTEQSPVHRETSASVIPTRYQTLDEMMLSHIEDGPGSMVTDVPGDIESAFDFEVDIADAKGNHIIVKRTGEGTPISGLVVKRERDGAYQLDWQASDRQIQGFAIYRRSGERPGLTASAFEKIVSFVPNYGQGDDQSYHYTFTDHPLDGKVIYDYEVRVLEWGVASRGDAERLSRLAVNR